MTEKEREGYEWAWGVSRHAGEIIIAAALIGSVLLLLRIMLSIGVDDSDQNGWKRSGLKIHKDAKTGIEYLSDGNGGLVRREK